MSGQMTPGTLCVMPREMRMMTERTFSLTSLPKGFALMAVDTVMYSQKLGLGGFALLEREFALLKNADPSRIAVAAENGSTLHLDAGGEHAWFAVLTIVDLLGELVSRFGTAEIAIKNVAHPEELAIAPALAARSGLAVTIPDRENALLTATPAETSGDLRTDEPVLWDLLRHGARIEVDLWWRIYHLAQKALTPDSVVSRRHAGPLIVNDDGTVIGRRDNDDETDISFLTSVGSSSNQKERTES